MSPITIGLVVFACVFGGALLGMFLRTVLPEHHLSEASKDVVKLVTGLIATLAALVLGLLIASAKSSFDAANEGFRQSAARAILLDRTLAQYGPETKDVREMLRNAFTARIDHLFPKDRSKRSTLGAAQGTAAIEGFVQRLRALAPQTDAQRALQSRALEFIDSIAQARWMAIEAEENTIPTPFLVVLVLWLAAMFASFGLFAPRNATAIAVLFLGALSLSGAIFLIEELNDPLDGIISISRVPMDRALGFIGK
ncbi:MAG: hypothetical protein ABW318_12225 [Vicinamibacterales bacterium]